MLQQRGRAYARSARQRLALDAPLVGADGNRVRGEDLDEICVRASRCEVRVIAKRRPVPYNIHVVEILGEDDCMRDAGVYKVYLHRSSIDLETGWRSVRMGITHGHANLALGKGGPNSAGGCFETYLSHVGAEPSGETREATRTVSAHLRLVAVGIVVAHPEIRPVSWGLNDEKTIRADAAMSVAEPCHVGGVQHQPSVSVVEHDEVVPGAIHLAKGELHTQD